MGTSYITGKYTASPVAGADGQDIQVAVDQYGNVKTAASGPDYEAVAASQSAQILGATGAVGDVLDGLLIVPATTSPGVVTLADGDGVAMTVFAGGAGSVIALVPFFVPIGAKCIAETTPGWKVTTGSNVSVIAVGNFT
jgi:hypothetical protein